MLFQTCEFLPLNTKENIWKMLVTKQLTVAIDFHNMKKKYSGSQWVPCSNYWVTNIFKNIIFCVQKK